MKTLLSSFFVFVFLFSALAPLAEASKGALPTEVKNSTNWRHRAVNRYRYKRRRIEALVGSEPSIHSQSQEERREELRKVHLLRRLQDSYKYTRSSRLLRRIKELEAELEVEDVEMPEETEEVETPEPEEVEEKMEEATPPVPRIRHDGRIKGPEQGRPNTRAIFEECKGLTRTRLSLCYYRFQEERKKQLEEARQNTAGE